MRRKSEQYILQTLVYGDIFDYPLSKDQLWKFLIAGEKVSYPLFEKILILENQNIYRKNNWYCLRDNKKNIEKRIVREKESKEKILHAKKILKPFFLFPGIQFIGISGSLALLNAAKKDDIDVFVITVKNTLWISRFLLIFGLFVLGKYRRRQSKDVSNKICVNMVIDDSSLRVSKSKHNLYTAHEVVQVLPLFDKDGVFDSFLTANKWVLDFMPNSLDRIKNQESGVKNQKRLSSFIIHHSSFVAEFFAKTVQLLFINKHKTTEIIGDHLLAFHPHDYTNHILSEYRKRLRKCGIVEAP